MYKPTIGLEIHAELKTKSKMFCSCLNNPSEKRPNIDICPICTAQPGTLPVINKGAVRKTIKTGLALNCQISEYSKFDRKNYFYPDLPKGYQISQYDAPLCREGYLEIPDLEQNSEAKKSKVKTQKSKIQVKNQKFKKIRIRRVHLEEDTGRLIHPEGKDYSLIDFNRAGVPLMELVTEPDINSAKEARGFAEELQLILRYLDVSNADMEKGQMRCEVNISLSRTKRLGTKVEIKNLNSFKAVEKAIEYEIKRQTKVLEQGKKVVQETRGWHDNKEITFSQRAKEESHDYRYFPEPDLPALRIENLKIEKIKKEIPELPQEKRERFKQEYKITGKELEIFIKNRKLSNYFEKIVSELYNWLKFEKNPESRFPFIIKIAVHYLETDLLGLIKDSKQGIKNLKITPENFAEFVVLIYQGKISSKIAKIILGEMFKTGADPSHIIKEKGLSRISDKGELEKIIKEVISKNPKAVQDYKKGKENASQFLIGQVMAETKGNADPKKASEILKQTLDKTL